MKLAIMQPYTFPYVGYFQLISSVDRFVVYDDVTFIKQGWINRNQVLQSGKSFFFTIPLQDASSFRLIKDTEINRQQYQRWRDKFLKTIQQSYGKSPEFAHVFPMICQVMESESKNISILALNSIKAVCQYLDINTAIVDSSVMYENSHLSSQERVLDICRKEKATHYINAKGGQALYSVSDFEKQGIILKFISPKPLTYAQGSADFVPWLSIIDVLMANPKSEVCNFLNQYELT
jgi:hypothetical protein